MQHCDNSNVFAIGVFDHELVSESSDKDSSLLGLEAAVPVELAEFFWHVLAEDLGSLYQGGEPVVGREELGGLC